MTVTANKTPPPMPLHWKETAKAVAKMHAAAKKNNICGLGVHRLALLMKSQRIRKQMKHNKPLKHQLQVFLQKNGNNSSKEKRKATDSEMFQFWKWHQNNVKHNRKSWASMGFHCAKKNKESKLLKIAAPHSHNSGWSCLAIFVGVWVSGFSF